VHQQDSPQPELEGNHQHPTYNILCAWAHGWHPNVILSQDSQVVNLEIPKIGTLIILEAHNFIFKPPIEMKSK
jgi:hypothetical protein